MRTGFMKRAPRIIVQFIHLHGPHKGKIEEFGDPIIAIGRHPSCQVRFPADLAIVSRKHAEIQRDGNRFKIVDSSANGTFINGKRMKEAYLKDGDVLTLAEGGPKISFLTQMSEELSEEQVEVPARPVRSQPLPGQERPLPPQERPQPSNEALGRSQSRLQPANVRSAPVQIESVKMPLILQYGPTLRSFKQLPVNLGRHTNCELRIEHPAVLDMHAQFFYSQDQYWVKDLTGRGLIQINGQPISTQAALNTNDLLALSPEGPIFRFLGEGRLAEELPSDEPASSPKEDLLGHTTDSSNEMGSEEDRKSIFKRFFK